MIDTALLPITVLPALFGGVAALLICSVIVLTKQWHGNLTMDSMVGVQKFHFDPTPRVGGLGIYAGTLVAWLLADDSLRALLGPLLLAGLPAFGFGMLEDITKRVGVRDRLLATIASGVIVCLLTGTHLTRTDVWGLDALMTIAPLAIGFTAFAIGGVANAVNIIDGFNGLASGAILIGLAAIGLIAYQVGDAPLVTLCQVIAAVTLGFFLVNFPFGKIFLGDGGAYFLGFMVAWIAVLLLERNPGVSVWAPLLACSYPVLEVGFSMWRRKARALNPGHPDRLHLHSLVKSRIIKKKSLSWTPVLRNALVSPYLWLFTSIPGVLAATFYAHTASLIYCFVGCAYLYLVLYTRLVRFGWCLPRLFESRLKDKLQSA